MFEVQNGNTLPIFTNFGTFPFKAYYLTKYSLQNIFKLPDSIIKTESTWIEQEPRGLGMKAKPTLL